MIYFTFLEIARSVFAFIILGLAIGFFHSVSHELIYSLKRMGKLIFYTLSMRIERVSPAKNIRIPERSENKGFFSHLADFFRFLIYAFLYVIVSYVTLDVQFRIYSLLLTVFFGYISFKTFGNAFSFVYQRAFDAIYKVLYSVMRCIVLPIRCIVFMTFKFISNVTAPFRKRYRRFISHRIIKKKFSEIDVLFSHKMQKL